jgi:hypothetical protein
MTLNGLTTTSRLLTTVGVQSNVSLALKRLPGNTISLSLTRLAVRYKPNLAGTGRISFFLTNQTDGTVRY